MAPESDNFEGLQRLLKLKRYEQPPPGYFSDFSQQVIAQIKAGANTEPESLFDRLSWEVPWLRRLLESFQAKPALAMGFGAAVCALLVGGVIYSESLEFKPVQPVSLLPNVDEATASVSPAVAPPGFGLKDPAAVAKSPVNTNTSLSPVVPSGGSLFEQVRPIPAELTSGRP